MKHILLTENWLKETVATIKAGGLVIFPSDTVYGALVDATSKDAVEKLIRFKSRPPGKAISVFVDDMTRLSSYTIVTEKQRKVLQELLPGPFTVILPSSGRISSLLESEKHTLGIRFPVYEPIIRLVTALGFPVTATSANLSGRRPHYQISTLLNECTVEKKALIDLIIDAGILPRHKPSTIVDLTGEAVTLLRKGDVIYKTSQTYLTRTEEETRKLGEYLVEKYQTSKQGKPLVFILEGEVGVGKTQFAKGVGSFYGIPNIISPTFVIYYEYAIKKSQAVFVHCDLYNIEDDDEFVNLGLSSYLTPGNVICIEWGEKIGTLYKELSQKAYVVEIDMKHIDETTREITVHTHTK